MKSYFNLCILFFLLLIYGCAPSTTKVQWETGRVINPQFAEKVIIVEKFEFTAPLKKGIRTEVLVSGDISTCIVKSLRNNLIGYAVLREDEANNISPNAIVIKLTPTKVTTGYNFWGTKIVGNVYAKVQVNDSPVELEGEGKANAEMPPTNYAFETAFSEACDDLAVKVDKLLNKK
ncbi:hypothetical protein [Thermodesulfovibrio sp. 3462-1]|uniref:Lipoprotein n=2 Tax=Thermodesulfovibrio TaxID=28261 RepID=A0AAU8H4D5_9BACT